MLRISSFIGLWLIIRSNFFDKLKDDHFLILAPQLNGTQRVTEIFRIDVEIGFHTDFASIPRPLWMFLPRWGKYGNAAVIHDYLYWEQTRPRKESDDILMEGMVVLNVGAIKRHLIYFAVRIGGWWRWRRNQSRKRAAR